jgi:S1-C subfamily serine protease
MNWDDEENVNAAANEPQTNVFEAPADLTPTTPPAAPADFTTTTPPTAPTAATPSSTKGFFIPRFVAVAVLIVALAGGGFVVGHYVVTPPRQVAPQSRITFPTGGNSGFPNYTINPPSFSAPTLTPKQKRANAAAAKVATKVDPGLVDITSTFTTQGSTAMGTGMILTSSGLVLTNNHVIEDATSISARDVATNTTYTATVVGYDLTKDVALLQLTNASGLTTVKTGNSSKLTTGDKIVGIGNAGGAGGTPSFAAGTVKALDQTITAGDESNPAGSEKLSGLVEVNADILPGDSGGPLVTAKGKVIGMDTAGSAANGGFGFEQFGVATTSRGYAIPINDALKIVKSIEKGNSSMNVHVGATAFLGVEFNSASNLIAQPGQVATPGVALAGVVSGQPAASAGLVAGDVITSINGHRVTTGTQLQALLLTLRPGNAVKVGYVNTSGVASSATATLASGPAQ